MKISLVNRKTAVAALVAAAVVGGGVAYAYPPGSPMTVVATPSDGSVVTVTAYNVNPFCDVRFNIGGAGGADFTVVQNPRPGATTVSHTFTFSPALSGRHSIRARTVHCTKGSDKEHAKTDEKYIALDKKLTGEPTARVRKTYRVEASGVPEGTLVTFTFTPPSGSPVMVQDEADKRGVAKGRYTLGTVGAWSVVASADPPIGQIGTLTVTVS